MIDEYAKNGRLDFEILYEWQGATHRHIPDDGVVVGQRVNLIVKVKGSRRNTIAPSGRPRRSGCAR